MVQGIQSQRQSIKYQRQFRQAKILHKQKERKKVGLENY